jgi:hypothetical protein
MRPVLALLLAAAATAAPAAAASTPRQCELTTSEQTRLGATYVTSLAVSRVSCARGKQVVKAFQACRKAHGGATGRCPARPLGYRCTERRGGIATQFSAKVVCRRGAATVQHTYTQFT